MVFSEKIRAIILHDEDELKEYVLRKETTEKGEWSLYLQGYRRGGNMMPSQIILLRYLSKSEVDEIRHQMFELIKDAGTPYQNPMDLSSPKFRNYLALQVSVNEHRTVEYEYSTETMKSDGIYKNFEQALISGFPLSTTNPNTSQ